MKALILTASLLYSTLGLSAILDCRIQVNQEFVSQYEVTTALNQKTMIDNVEGIYAYVTEKEKDHFVIEAYLVDYDVRIYGEGTIRSAEDKVVASLWGRASIIDIDCMKASGSAPAKHSRQ